MRPIGQLSIVWSVAIEDPDELLQIVWSEVAGKPVTPPERRGFGSMVIEGSIAHEPCGTVDRRFLREGLQVTLRIPLAQVAAMPPVSIYEH